MELRLVNVVVDGTPTYRMGAAAVRPDPLSDRLYHWLTSDFL
jgi:hypothetical protein